MSDAIVAAVRQRMEKRRVDLGRAWPVRLRPASPDVIAADERYLGFALPPLLKRLYREIGNGGFGPGYGLIGLTGGVPDDIGAPAPRRYRRLRMGGLFGAWPEKLLPICQWHSSDVMSCIDCSRPGFPIRLFDASARWHGTWADAFFDECDSFDEWIGLWGDGVNLMARLYSEDGPVTRVMQARLASM